MDPGSARWSTLIIRVWRTEGEPGAFRARVSEVDDRGDPERTVTVAADPATVLATTSDWLARWVAAGGPPDPPAVR